MKTFIVSGSHRPESQSGRVARYIRGRLLDTNMATEVEILDLGRDTLPFWDEGMWSNDEKWQEAWGPIAKKLQVSDSLVVIAPEWNGMAPAALKNFFLLAGMPEVGHKPALLVGVSSGIGGTAPVMELRSSGYKNGRVTYLPEHIIVRNVESMLHDGEPSDEHDASLRDRIDFSLKILEAYTAALTPVRESGVTENKKFPYGM